MAKILLTRKQHDLLTLDFKDAWDVDRESNRGSKNFDGLELLSKELAEGREVTASPELREECEYHYDTLKYNPGCGDYRLAEMASYRGILRKLEKVGV